MGKVLAGMLFILVLGLGVVPAAGAAEIPPTAKCSKLNKKMVREYYEFLAGGPSKAETRKADRKFAEDLTEAGCISDAEPLLKKLDPKPYSKKCVAAAGAAGKFWAPSSRRVGKLLRNGERATKRLKRRTTRLRNRINRLKRRGASKQRIQALRRTRKAVVRKHTQLNTARYKRLNRLVAAQAYDTTLILTELISRRCLGLDADLLFGEGGSGPAARLTRKHGLLIFMSVLHLAIKHMDEGSASASSSGNAGGPAPVSLDDLRFPLISLP